MQNVISVALKTPLEIRLGICIDKTSLLHRPDDYIGFPPSCPPTFYNKIGPMFASSNKSNKKRQINVKWNKHKNNNKKQWGKACLCTGGGV